jgi:stress response protein SCP2
MEPDSSVSKQWEAMQLNDPAGALERAFAVAPFDSKEIVMGLHWDPAEEGVAAAAADLDALCVLFDAQGGALEVVYPGRPRNANGSVIHTGDSQTGASEWDDESIFAFLDALPETVAALAFVVVSTAGRAFRGVRGARCHLSDRFTEHAWVRLDLTSLDGHAPHCVAALRRGPAAWEISAAAGLVHDELMLELQSLVVRGKTCTNRCA